MGNRLYGSNYITSQRSSGYKSTIYSMAEIVDNSVDAGATKVDILFIEAVKGRGQKTIGYIDKIIFLDNGKGMTEERLNGCLVFSDGEGISDTRIGAFGVGLPTSSLSVGKRVEVFSRTNERSNWMYTFLDVEDQLNKADAEIDFAIYKNPDFDQYNIPDALIQDAKTIIVWSKLDKLDAAKAETLITRGEKLMGRIYRYKLTQDLKINFRIYNKGNSNEEILKPLLAYDPLYVTESKYYMTSEIWQYAQNDDPQGKHTDLSNVDPQFNSKFHYAKFIEGCIENETSLPLFEKLDGFWDAPTTITLNGKSYTWTIRAAYAKDSIANPGIRNGGGTKIGREFGKKMSGDPHFKSANIYFLRAGREIDFGNFGMYTVTDEKNRFWTIEIHFQSDLDDLLGVSMTKQSVDFKFIDSASTRSYDINEELPQGIEKDLIYQEMSSSMKRAIKLMKKKLKESAKRFSELEKNYLNAANEGNDPDPITTIDGTLRPLFPPGGTWNPEQIERVVDLLFERFPNISREDIHSQVIKEAEKNTKTIVLYAPNETGNLFELREIDGRLITFINTNHNYYQNIILPLKTNPSLKIFAISIEMLVSSLAYEMDKLSNDSEENNIAFEDLLQNISISLARFIRDRHIEVNALDFVRNDVDDDDDDEFEAEED